MSKRVETFAFDLLDKVMVKEIQRPGMIEALMIDFLGPQYRVAWWDNGKREFGWLPERDIEAR